MSNLGDGNNNGNTTGLVHVREQKKDHVGEAM